MTDKDDNEIPWPASYEERCIQLIEERLAGEPTAEAVARLMQRYAETRRLRRPAQERDPEQGPAPRIYFELGEKVDGLRQALLDFPGYSILGLVPAAGTERGFTLILESPGSPTPPPAA